MWANPQTDYKVSGYRVRAVYSYKRQTLDELEFEDGDRINNVKIVSDYGDGWWYGECNGNKGYFPSNYVKVSSEIIDESRPPLGAREPEDRPNDVRDEYGQTPLHTAAFSDNCDAVFSLLLKGQNNINAQDRNGWTPIHCAARFILLPSLFLLSPPSHLYSPLPPPFPSLLYSPLPSPSPFHSRNPFQVGRCGRKEGLTASRRSECLFMYI